jgi:phosphonate transport system permease protein
MVGGGGIGFYLADSLRVSKYDQVIAFLLVIIVLVFVVEGASMLLRRALK